MMAACRVMRKALSTVKLVPEYPAAKGENFLMIRRPPRSTPVIVSQPYIGGNKTWHVTQDLFGRKLDA